MAEATPIAAPTAGARRIAASLTECCCASLSIS
jgi:hypothetical protein